MKYYLTLLLFLTFNQSFSQTYIGYNEKVSLELVQEINLKENINFLGKIVDFEVENNKIYLVDSRNPSIVEYNHEGVQQKIYNKKGRGPFELVRPSLIRIIENKIFIWDNTLLKLSSFTPNFDPYLEISDFPRAISDFHLIDDQLILYLSGGAKGPLIAIYEMDKKKEKRISVIDKSSEHIMLMRLEQSGGLDVINKNIFYTAADQPELYNIYSPNFLAPITSHKLNFNNFEVEKINENPTKIINNNPNKMLDYISQNSRMINVVAMNEYTVVEAHTGTLNRNNEDPFKDRKSEIVILDNNQQQIDLINISELSFTSSALRASFDNNIYVLFEDIKEENNRYKIQIWKLEKSN